MTRKKIYLLTILMSLALIGVLAFQFYWIQGVIQINEQRFKQQVQEALIDVAVSLEQQEVAEGMLQAGGHRQLPDNSFSFRFQLTDSGSSRQYFQQQEKEPLPEDAFSLQFQLADSLPFKERGQQRAMEKAVEKRLKDRIRAMERQSQAQQRQMMDKWRQQQQQTEAMVYRFFRQGMRPEQRIDSAVLDSLIWFNLRERGITAKYNYAVFDLNRRKAVYHTVSQPEKLLDSPYQARLFPGDLMGSQTILSLSIPNQTRYLLGQMAWPLALMAIFVLIIIGCFAYAVRIILRQKKLSEMKSDFINNMTHEFKTPIATVGMACEALGDPDLQTQPNIMERYLGIIRQENKRLGQQVEKVLQIARLEKQAPELKYETINLANVLEQVVGAYRMRLNEEAILQLHLETKDPMLEADKLHITNIINNLLDNALKYSLGEPNINFWLSDARLNGKAAFLLRISDRGIGIAKENLDKIFDKFYRVPTGNVHNVKGFGLGLAYVKYSVEAHGGTISVQSKLNEGTTFQILLPKHPQP